jgi:type I restriction enzyme, S subunit
MNLVKLDSVCEVIAGQSPPSSTYNKTGEGIPFFQGKTDFGELYPVTRMWCSEPLKISLPNDILISVRAPVGPTNINNVKACIGRGLSAIRCSNRIDLKFLLHFLRFNEQKIADKGTGSTFKAITQKELKLLEIPLLPLAEQQKIAAILDAANSLRQKDQQLVERYTILSQSLFLEMFGDPVTNPMGWEIKAADSVIDLLTGYAFKSKDYSNDKDDIHLCGGLIITPTGIDWNKANLWSRNNLHGLERYRVKDGDIVMAMDRPWISSGFKIHKITESDKNSLLVQRTARIRAKNINQDFLYFLFKHPAFENQANTTETTVPHISPKDIRNYKLIIPPQNLQNQFGEGIKLIEAQKKQAQASLQKSEALFNSLLQQAFTGELTRAPLERAA